MIPLVAESFRARIMLRGRSAEDRLQFIDRVRESM